MTQTSNRTIDRHRTFAKHWMITATAIYGLMLLGLLTAIATGGSDDMPAGVTSTRSAGATPVFQPGRISQALTPSADTTDGHNKATEPAPPTIMARPAPVPIPEADAMADVFSERAGSRSQANTAPAAQGSEALVENGWDFNAPDSIPGFGSMPQPGDAPLSDDRQLTARAKR
ncbi:MAG TPA: hypothetical protein VJL90_00005 [Pseudorhodoplanes sp.]|nr:hypothetical protein [Pseudorhodoplanes sp.]